MLQKRLLPYAAIFMLLQLLVRISLFMRTTPGVEFGFSTVASVLVHGLWFDIAAASFILLPITLYHLCLPAGKHGGKSDRIADAITRFIFSYIFVFSAVAEHLFWTEFTTRFNFIAVDYLIYTQEVIGNIVESYPLYWLLSGIGLVSAAITWASIRFMPLAVTPYKFSSRFKAAMVAVFASVALYFASAPEQAQFKENAEATELASNGIYSLFSAFWNNEISYDRFYAVQDPALVATRIRTLLSEKGSAFVTQSGEDITRTIRKTGTEKHLNVMLVVMESLSADYMGVFGNTKNLTPNLDRLSKEGVFFSNLYATGTRTVRGLEALTLSIPPTPGQSIIRRPGNENLYSIGFIFKDRGYDTKFIYGGFGYFDNMNAYFAANGFDIVDRNDMKPEEVEFANVWGVCDEDMFTRAIKEADATYAKGKPFFHLIMTTSNHRPFTFPEGRIDLKSKSGRFGGVKYADYSVGKLIEDARKKPWFKDTVFVFVSDHTAGAGGKAELDPHKYHIPMIFYAPEHIKPKEYSSIASQIDFAPILLGKLNFSYPSKFYGRDLLNAADATPHTFISNYQKVALVKNSTLTVLAPKRKVDQFSWPDVVPKTTPESSLIDDAVAYYQSASRWKENHQRIPTVFR